MPQSVPPALLAGGVGPDPARRPEPPAPSPALVVGIGASAGGLEALQALVRQLDPGGQAAYVVAQHLAPGHPSQLVELLSRCTALKVVTAEDQAPLRPGVIAVVPPHRDVAVDRTRLLLREPSPRFGPSPGIDALFASIADHWGEQGVAVVLSGTGSDGALGVRTVRGAGGLTMAQQPGNARFDGMPRAAISLGGAELVLEAEAIGQRLNGLVSGLGGVGWRNDRAPVLEPDLLPTVTNQLRQITGIDFSLYKASTLSRQVQRRLAIRGVASIEDYLPLLAADGAEARALVQNLLVTVTMFFRDPDAFEALAGLLRGYLGGKRPGESIRVWVPGCATGEEAYSLAMLISQVLGYPFDLSARLKIFATDLDDQSLMIARRGVYPASAIGAIPGELRQRFVLERDGEMEVTKELRSCLVFARHNVGEDPPFAGLDLISCRNTLIYFTVPLQERVLDLFAFSLLPAGLLFLGSSESLGARTPGFTMVDSLHRIYCRTSLGRPRGQLPRPGPVPRLPLPVLPSGRLPLVRDTVPEQHVALLEALVRTLVHPALVVDENHDLVEVIGDVTPYCRIPEGRLALSVGGFLRAPLQAEARAMVLLVRADGVAVTSQPLSVEGMAEPVRLQASPLQVGERTFTVIAFLPDRQPAPGPTLAVAPSERDVAFGREIERLEREVLSSQDTLRRSLAELEQANEELEASSEELQASSEELQSSNEELEASNEELQATNEELGTLNQQLRIRSDELQRLNTDLENIQASLSQGMVIVDRNLLVTRFSPLAVRVFGLVDSDIGQPLVGVPTTVPLPGLRETLQAVIAGEARLTLEASSEEVSYLVQVLPYRDRDGQRLGAILTLTDVSELVALRRVAEASLREFSSLTDALQEVVLKRDQAMGHLLYVSQRIQALTGWTPADVCARPALLEEAIEPEDRPRVQAARDSSQPGWVVTYRFRARDGSLRWLQESATVVHGPDESFVVGTLSDRTDLRLLEDQRDEQARILDPLFQTELLGVALVDRQLVVTRANGRFCRLLGMTVTEVQAWPLQHDGTDPHDHLVPLIRSVLSGGEPVRDHPLQLQARDGTLHLLTVEVQAVAGSSAVVLLVQERPSPGG